MADARLALLNSWLKPDEVHQKTKVRVVGEGGLYPSKFKTRVQLAVIIVFDGVERKLPINQNSLIKIANSYTLETKLWVGKYLYIQRHHTRPGGDVTIAVEPAPDTPENIRAFAPLKKE